MPKNATKIKTIYKSLLSLLVLSGCGLGLFVYFVDPFENYTAPYQFFIILTLVLFFGILFAIVYVRYKVFKNLNFAYQIHKQAFNTLVFASSSSFFLLLIYANSLNLVSLGIFVVTVACYWLFEFLD
jgi:hypothetical protein